MDKILSNPTNLAIIIVIFFIVGIFITRAIFSIERFLAFQKAQTFLLAKIARQQGTPESEIRDIIDKLELYEPKESDKPK